MLRVPMATYEYLDHTADMGIVARGRDFADALTGVAEGMFAFIAELETVQPREVREVRVESADREALVVDWLNELLYRFEAEGFLPRRFEVLEVGSCWVRARCLGEPVDVRRHRLNAAVKAATYHQLQIQENGECRIQVILDI